ncbi:MAG: methyltransferase domain-containing protein [Rhodothermales bacterium]
MPRWILKARAVHLDEIMDDPDCDPVQLGNTYEWFERLNPWLGRWNAVYRSHIRPHLHPDRTTRILDIGCGAGDVLRLIGRLAERDGFEVQSLGIDPDPRAISYARQLGDGPALSFEACHSSDLVTRGASFDVVLSNHVLHHLTSDQLRVLVNDSETLSNSLVVHNDIKRDDLAWVAFLPVGMICRNSFILTDGLRSIRRAWHTEELEPMLPSGWTVETRSPFRLLLTRTRNPTSSPLRTSFPSS